MKRITAHNKRQKLKQILRSTTSISAAAIFATMQLQSAYALPQGAQVQQGQVQFDQQGNTLTVNQGSSKAIINWNSFDIGANETTHFNQPNSSAIALNRITGSQQPSQIFGALTATGKIILINPNGIVFGQDSKVDVGSLIASTANIKDQDFLADNFTFSEAGDPNARIISFGEINAKEGGLVALIAPGVENHGLIRAKKGNIVLAGGDTATLDLFGDGLLNFVVDGKSTGVDNQGVLQADAGSVIMTAKAARGVVDNLINTDGVIEANSATQKGGTIILGGGSGKARISGTVSAKGTSGGSIEITADVVALEAADVDASGLNAGGKIRVGGDKRGEDKLQMASLTTIDKDSVLKVNATSSGKGGDLAVWSTDATDFKGHVEGKGISEGGFVEVSSTGELGFTGSADLSAASGNNGTLLLDPDNVTIGNNAANDAEIADRDIDKNDGAGTFYISALSLVNALNVSNVVIEAIKTITVNEVVDASSKRNGSSLTLDARTITLNKSIMLNNGNLNLYGNTISMKANASIGSGKFQFGTQGNAGGAINSVLVDTNATLNGQSLTANSINYFTQKGAINLSNDFNVTANTRYSATGDVSVADKFEIKGNSEVTLANVTAKSVNVDSKKLTINKAVEATAGSAILDGANSVFVNTAGSVKSTAGSATIKADNGTVTMRGAVDVRDNLTLSALNHVTNDKSIKAGGDVTVTAGQNFTGKGTFDVRDLRVTVGRDVALSGAITASDDVVMTAANRLTTNGTITANDEVKLTSTGNTSIKQVTGKTVNVAAAYVTANNAVEATGGTLKLNGTNGVNAKGALSANSGSLDVDASNGAVTIRGAVNVRDNATVDASKAVTVYSTLDTGGDTTINTADSVSLRGNVDVRDLNVTATKNIGISGTVTASDDVRVNAAGTVSTSKAIVANDAFELTGNRVTVAAVSAKTINADVTTLTANGDLVTTGGTLKLDGEKGVNLKGDVTSSSGSIDIDSALGAVSITGDLNARDNAVIDAKSNITARGDVTTGGDTTLDSSAASVSILGDANVRDLNVAANKNAAINGSVTASDDVRLNAVGTTTVKGDITASDEFVLTGNRTTVAGVSAKTVNADVTTITANGDITATGGALKIDGERGVNLKGDVTASNSSVDIDAANGAVTVKGDIDAKNSVNVDAKSNIAIAGVKAGNGDVNVNTVNRLTVTGTVESSDDVNLTGGKGILGGGDIIANDEVNLNANSDIRLGGVDTNGDLDINSTRGVVLDGDVNAKNLNVGDKTRTLSLLGNTDIDQNLNADNKTKVTIGGTIDADNLNINLDVITVANPQMDIQYAIDLVNDGGRVYIAGGTYTQHSINLNRGITVQGAGRDKTTIDATGGDHAFIVGGDADNVRIYHLTIANADKSGLLIDTKGDTLNRIYISNARLSNNGESGLALADNSLVNGLYVTNTIFANNAADGISGNINAKVDNVSLNKVTFAENGDNGFEHVKGNNVTVRNSIFDGNNRKAMAIDAAEVGAINWVRTYDNKFTGEQATHIAIKGDVDIRNKANKTLDFATNANGVRDALIADNTFDTLATVSDVENGDWQDATGEFALFGKIGSALDAAQAGEWIDIAAGDYTESFTLDKAITLNGAGSDKVTLNAKQNTALSLDTKVGEDITIKGMTIAGGDIGIDMTLPAGEVDFDDTVFANQTISGVFFRDATRAFGIADIKSDATALNTALVASDYVAPPPPVVTPPTPVVADPVGDAAPVGALQNTIFSQIAQRGKPEAQNVVNQGPSKPILDVNKAGFSQDNTVIEDLNDIASNNAKDDDE